jgi:hypothetical protein
MSVPVSTGCEVNVAPREYKSGEMQAGLSDGDRARKVAFITGVTGQDGSYLVELLLSKGANGAMDRSTRKSSRIRASRARVGARMDARGGRERWESLSRRNVRARRARNARRTTS